MRIQKTWSQTNPKFGRSILIRVMLERLRGDRLASIAARYGMDPSYVSKLFNAATNCTGFRYRELPRRLRLRVLAAAEEKYLKHIERIAFERRLVLSEAEAIVESVKKGD